MRPIAVYGLVAALSGAPVAAELRVGGDEWTYVSILQPERSLQVAQTIYDGSCPAYETTEDRGAVTGVPHDSSLPTVRVTDRKGKKPDQLELELGAERVMDEGLEGRANFLERGGDVILNTTKAAESEGGPSLVGYGDRTAQAKGMEALYRLTEAVAVSCDLPAPTE